MTICVIVIKMLSQHNPKTRKWLQIITLLVMLSFLAGILIVGGLSFRSGPPKQTPANPRSAVTTAARDELRQWEEAAKQNPRDPFVLRGLTRAQLENGEISEAKNTLAKAARLSGTDPLNEELFGLIALSEGNPKEAAAAFKKALELKPKDAIFQFELSQAERLEKVKTHPLPPKKR